MTSSLPGWCVSCFGHGRIIALLSWSVHFNAASETFKQHVWDILEASRKCFDLSAVYSYIRNASQAPKDLDWELLLMVCIVKGRGEKPH
ncbi:hypothetical protein ACRRTK_012817 [Alexandromys fortis]